MFGNSVQGRFRMDDSFVHIPSYFHNLITAMQYIFAGLPMTTLVPLKRVLNTAARTVPNMRPGDHVTPAIRELRWLPVTAWIK